MPQRHAAISGLLGPVVAGLMVLMTPLGGQGKERALPVGLIALSPLRPPDALRPVSPEALAVDELDRLFVLDRARGRILKVGLPEDSVDTWAAFGVGDQGGIRYSHLARLFAQWGPDLFAMDPTELVFYQFDLQGRLKNTMATRAGLTADEVSRLQPVDFVLTRSGELLVLDRAGARLLEFDRFGRFVTDWTAGTAGGPRLLSPTSLAQTAAGGVFVLDPPASAIHAFTRDGTSLGSWRYDQDLKAAELEEPLLGATPWDQIIVAGRDFSWLRLFDEQGRLLRHWANPHPSPFPLSDLAVSSDSLVYLASPRGGEVEMYRWIFSDSLDAEDR